MVKKLITLPVEKPAGAVPIGAVPLESIIPVGVPDAPTLSPNLIQDPNTGKWYEVKDVEKLTDDPRGALNLFRTGGLEAIIERERKKGEKESEIEYTEYLKEFEEENVKLKSGEYIPKEEFEKLSKENQTLLMEQGTQRYNLTKERELELWETDNIQLDTGEWVGRSELNKLPDLEQSKLLSLGIEKYNQWLQEGIKKGEEALAKLKKFISVSRPPRGAGAGAMFAALAQVPGYNLVEAIKSGITNTTLLLAGFKQIDINVAEDTIAKLKELETYRVEGGYDIDKALDEGMSEAFLITAGFSKRDIQSAADRMKGEGEPTTQLLLIPFPHIQPSEAFLRRQFEDTVDWSKLSIADDKTRAQTYIVISNQNVDLGEELFKEHNIPMPSTQARLGAMWTTTLPLVAEQIIPVYGTVVNWDEMSRVERGISIAIDVAVILPLFRWGVQSIRAAKMPIKYGLKSLLKTESLSNKLMLKHLERDISRQAAAKYKLVSRLELKYIKVLTKIEILTSKTKGITPKAVLKLEAELAKAMKDLKVVSRFSGLDTPARIKAQALVNRLTKKLANTPLNKAQSSADDIAKQLEAALKDYTASVRASGKIGFDSPQVASMFDNLPKETMMNIRSVVSSLKVTKVDIKQLKLAVVNAEKALQGAKAKFPSRPSMWADLLFDLSMAESKLLQAQRGSIKYMINELVRLRGLYSKSKGIRRIKLGKQITKLQKELDTVIKSLEVEWALGGPLTPGRAEVVVAAPPTGGTLTRIQPVVSIQVPVYKPILLPRLVKVFVAGESEMPEIKPMITESVKTITTGITDAEVITEIERALATGTEAAIRAMAEVQLKPAVETAVNTAILASIQPITSPQVKAAVKAQVKPMIKAAVKTATQIATQIATKPIRPRFKPFPWLTFPELGGAVKTATKTDFAGSICWRQGKVWWVISYPYMDKSDVECLSYPPPGAKIVKGPKSAYKTIQTLTGTPPRELKLDLGIMDINITKGSKMGYSRDIEQETEGHIELKGVRI